MPFGVRYSTVVLLNNGTTITTTDGFLMVADDAVETAEQSIHESILDQWRVLLAANAPFDLGECDEVGGPSHPGGHTVYGRVAVAAREIAAIQTVVRDVAPAQNTAPAQGDAPEADPGGVE